MLDKKYLIGGGILLVIVIGIVVYMTMTHKVEKFDILPPMDNTTFQMDKYNNIMPSYLGANKGGENMTDGIFYENTE